MDRIAKFKTINGCYEPRKVDLHLFVAHDGMPNLALIAEPIKVYNNEYNGIIFYKRVSNSSNSSTNASRYGGSSISKHGYTRSIGL